VSAHDHFHTHARASARRSTPGLSASIIIDTGGVGHKDLLRVILLGLYLFFIYNEYRTLCYGAVQSFVYGAQGCPDYVLTNRHPHTDTLPFMVYRKIHSRNPRPHSSKKDVVTNFTSRLKKNYF